MLEATTGSQAWLWLPRITLISSCWTWGLPDVDGLEVIKRLREWSHTPIIVISARGKDTEKVAGLDAGADDYLAKPFSVEELAAACERSSAVHANPRRKGRAGFSIWESCGWTWLGGWFGWAIEKFI